VDEAEVRCWQRLFTSFPRQAISIYMADTVPPTPRRLLQSAANTKEYNCQNKNVPTTQRRQGGSALDMGPRG